MPTAWRDAVLDSTPQQHITAWHPQPKVLTRAHSARATMPCSEKAGPSEDTVVVFEALAHHRHTQGPIVSEQTCPAKIIFRGVPQGKHRQNLRPININLAIASAAHDKDAAARVLELMMSPCVFK